jgi:phage major head subunit gpT-like protein
MLVTQAALEAINVGFQTTFQNALQPAQSPFAQLATRVESTAKLETYGWLAAMPQWRPFLGERHYKSFAEKDYILINQSWEKTAEIPIEQVEDDKLGIWTGIVAKWGQTGSGELPEIQIAAALKAGLTTLCYDGQHFFDPDHPVGDAGAVFSNKFGDGSGNPWYLVALNQEIKPFIYQERKAPEFTMVTNPADSYVFNNRKIPIGSFARSVAGYSFPHYASYCDGPLNAANYAAMLAAMTSLTDDEGRPLGIKPTHLVYGASNRSAALQLIKAQFNAAGASNIYYQDVELIDGSMRLP